jgi:hypothetical protein
LQLPKRSFSDFFTAQHSIDDAGGSTAGRRFSDYTGLISADIGNTNNNDSFGIPSQETEDEGDAAEQDRLADGDANDHSTATEALAAECTTTYTCIT